jgi:pSer/pThr/pTyr-binding forkhead associated (FHA) protein
MSSHLEVCRPSGRQLIALTGQRITVGKLSTSVVSLHQDATVSRVHAVLENFGCAWSIRDLGSRNGTYVNGEKIIAERVLRSGDELRLGNSRLIFWQATQADAAPADDNTESDERVQLRPRLTPRELDVLVALCRPLVSGDHFAQPASIQRMASELFVTEAAIKQHLQNLYEKFGVPTEGGRRVALANDAVRRGAVSRAMLGDQHSHDIWDSTRPEGATRGQDSVRQGSRLSQGAVGLPRHSGHGRQGVLRSDRTMDRS